jgi:hypothetical protein
MSYTLNGNATSEFISCNKEKFNIKNFSKENKSTYLISYNKSNSKVNDDNSNTIGLYRSTIFLNDDLVCFSPPKALSFNHFYKKYPNLDDSIIIEEFVEGTMINVYYDNISKTWEIATKNNVGATNHFYKNSITSFGNLFYKTALFANFNLDEHLDKRFCYSFVMKHPLNQIVGIINHPSLYLIEIYQIVKLNDTEFKINIVTDSEVSQCLTSKCNILLPKKYNFNTYSDVDFPYLFDIDDAHYIRSYIKMGYVFKNKITGERCKLRNQEYEYLHQLVGNQPDFFYHYMQLRQSGNMKSFLKYFPEYTDMANECRGRIHSYTENLWAYYFEVKIVKSIKLSDVHYAYKPHVYKIHGQYMEGKVQNPYFKVDKKYIMNYVNNLHPSVLMYAINKYNV